MNTEKQINLACVYAGISQAELARRVNISPQTLNKRLKVGKFTKEELAAIAAALGAEYVSSFVFPDGKAI